MNGYIVFGGILLIALIISGILLYRKYRKKQTPLNTEDIDKSSEYKNEFDKFNSDIKYLNDQKINLIISSLKNDFDQFKKNPFFEDLYSTKMPEHWVISNTSSSYCCLLKQKSGERIKIYVYYEFSNKYELSIKSISYSETNWKLNDDIIDIFSKYLYMYFIHTKKFDMIEAQNNYNKISKIVGKDVIRDGRIDDILNDII